MARSVLGGGTAVPGRRDDDARDLPPASTGDIAATLTGAFGGLALVVSALLPWPGDGPGSTMAAHRFAELLLADVAAAWVPSWLGLIVYIVPAGGALIMVASGLSGRFPAVLKVCGLVAAAAITAATVVLLLRRSSWELGPGAVAAIVGTLLALLSIVLDHRPAGRRSTVERGNDSVNSREDPCSV